MTHPRTAGFNAARPLLKAELRLADFSPGLIRVLDAFADGAGVPRISAGALAPSPVPPPLLVDPSDPLTARVALELIGHEAIVQELYLDSKGIATWGIGVTSRSGHDVERYRDNPQPIVRCIEIYIWLLRNRYIPDVLAEFAGRDLTEAQFAAALSFHYNTGAIRRASWVDLWLAGNEAEARRRFMDWRNPPEIVERREAERDLFFDGVWSQDGKATVWPVRKPSRRPDWRNGQRVDVTAAVAAALTTA